MKKTADTTKQLAELRQKYDELNNKYLRALADYQNLTKRTAEQVEDVRRFAGERIITGLLPILDTLYMANDHLKDAGLDLAVKQFQAVLGEMGVKKIDTTGVKFDPHQMECIEVVEGENNIVVAETRSGYKMHDRVIRVAQVKVGQKNIKI